MPMEPKRVESELIGSEAPAALGSRVLSDEEAVALARKKLLQLDQCDTPRVIGIFDARQAEVETGDPSAGCNTTLDATGATDREAPERDRAGGGIGEVACRGRGDA